MIRMSDHVEVAILACLPRDEMKIPQQMRHQMAAMNVSTGGPMYKGSVEEDCRLCGEGVWVAPEQQAKREASPNAIVACMRCAAEIVAGGDVEVHTLSGKKWGE